MHNLESHLSKFSEGGMPLDPHFDVLMVKNVYKLHNLESIFHNLPGGIPTEPLISVWRFTLIPHQKVLATPLNIALCTQEQD